MIQRLSYRGKRPGRLSYRPAGTGRKGGCGELRLLIEWRIRPGATWRIRGRPCAAANGRPDQAAPGVGHKPRAGIRQRAIAGSGAPGLLIAGARRHHGKPEEAAVASCGRGVERPYAREPVGQSRHLGRLVQDGHRVLRGAGGALGQCARRGRGLCGRVPGSARQPGVPGRLLGCGVVARRPVLRHPGDTLRAAAARGAEPVPGPAGRALPG